MKLKQKPTDFIVEELTNIHISEEKKEHTVYLLEKQEIDTFTAVRFLSSQLNIPLFEIGYAGLKDKHAVTKQYISLPTRYAVDCAKLTNVTLCFKGYIDQKIKIGDLQGNHFTITVRDIKSNELKNIETQAQSVSLFGVPNYYDSQRFGSVFKKEFVAQHVLCNNFEQAVKIYLTEYLKSEPKRTKNIKRKILDHWQNLDTITIRDKQYGKVLETYQRTHSWQQAYKKIPAYLRELYVNAYQSFLWNECIKELLKKHIDKDRLFFVPYHLGSLLFYEHITDQEKNKVPETFQTISPSAVFSDVEQPIVQTVLSRHNLSLPQFDIVEKTGNFFKTRPRPTLVVPELFTISKPEIDELNTTASTQRYRIQLSFSLPKGSYATIVTKKIFGT